MPRLHWKAIVAVFVLAIGTRWALQHRVVHSPGAPPTLKHTGGPDEAHEAANAPVAPKGPLVFDPDPVELKPRPEDDEIETTFHFTNTGSKPLTVTGLESTCSCLEASVDQRTYAPGTRGSGKALFKVSSFVGRHEKTLHLYTDDPAAPEQVLTFILDVPVVVSIEPNLLTWTQGDAPEPKTMVIRMVGEDPMRITKITPTRENVRHELKEITPGREYHLVVTPTSTDVVTVGGFKIETDSKIPKYARQMAFFSFERPDLAEKKKKAVEAKHQVPGIDR
jgi:hypothetical protein